MKQHKWHKEIKAWADGAELQYKNKFDPDDTWDTEVEMEPEWNSKVWEFRIKPQPKEKKYLYVYHKNGFPLDISPVKWFSYQGYEYLGKIEVQND